MVTCVVKNCRSSTRDKKIGVSKKDGVSYHRFPRCTRKEKWTQFVRKSRGDDFWSPHKNSSICSKHFRLKDFCQSSNGIRLLSKTAVPEFMDEKTSEERPNRRSKYVKVRLQNASKMEDKIPLMDIKVEPSIVGDQPTSDSEIMNQQRTVIADIIKSIMHSLDLLIKSDPDNIRSANVRDKIIVALFSYQDIIEEKQLHLTSYKEVDIFDNSNNLKEIDIVYNDIKDDNSEDSHLSNDDSHDSVDDIVEDETLSDLRKKLAVNLNEMKFNENSKFEKHKLPKRINKKFGSKKDLDKVINVVHNYSEESTNTVPDDSHSDTDSCIKEYLSNIKNNRLIRNKMGRNLPRISMKCKPVKEITSDSKNHLETIDNVYNDDNCEDLPDNIDDDDDSIEDTIISDLKKQEADLVKDIEGITQPKIHKPVKGLKEKIPVKKTNKVADVGEEMIPEDENNVPQVKTEYSKENLGFESTVPRYVCDICDVTVISEHHLTMHKHLCKRRQYYYYGNPLLEEYWDKITCPLCDMKGKHRANLPRHYMSHKVKDIEAALASLKEKGLNPENPEGNMELLNDFIQEFESKEKVDGDELSPQSGNTIQVHTEGNICKKPSIDDYVKFNLKKIVYDVDINKELFCFPCDIMFQTKQDLEEHRKKINDTDAFVCNHCDKTFDVQLRLAIHTKCHRGLYNPKSLYLNYKSEDTDGCPSQIDCKLYACKYCLAIFVQEISLHSHYKYYKNNGVCHGKRNQTTNKSLVTKRVPPGIQRNSDGKLQCNQCDKSYGIYHRFMEHLASHSETFKYFCECGKGFKSKDRLKFHIKVVHVKKFRTICEECGISVTRANFKRHMRVHSNLKPFKCSFCSKTFKYKEGLTSHTRTHTKEKPWKCKYCGMDFSELRTYNTHINIHEGKTPYKCTECPSAFVSKLKLNKHVAEHQDCRNSI